MLLITKTPQFKLPTISQLLHDINKRLTQSDMKKFGIYTVKILTILFALVGVVLCAAYVGVNLHLTDTEGIVDSQVEVFWKNGKQPQVFSAASQTQDAFFTVENYCALQKIKTLYPGTFLRILNAALDGKKMQAQNNLNVAMLNLNVSNADCSSQTPSSLSQKDFEAMTNMVDVTDPFLLSTTTEWAFFKTGVLQDTEVLRRVEGETGIKSRVLVSIMVAEQMRLFYSDRAWFKQAIAPSKMLASMSQFSLGVMGVKNETAVTTEDNLKNPDSPFYPGAQFEHALDFKTPEIDAERFARITNSHDHYYSYLYAALYCKEIIAQWKKAGFDISDRPEILATLFNIGFSHSTPNADPQIGGAGMTIEGRQFSFGGLAYTFYYSGELLDEFPQ